MAESSGKTIQDAKTRTRRIGDGVVDMGAYEYDTNTTFVSLTTVSAYQGLVIGAFFGLGVLGILLNLNQVFNLRFFVGLQILDTSYYYALIGLFLAAVFLLYPGRRVFTRGPAWDDWLLAAASRGSSWRPS